MLKSIEVENFRSFAETARLELRPITILLGRNSAGKSSLTRLFPLFRQSMARETSSPILWTSTTNIDFGRIGDVINRGSKSDVVRIGFELDTATLSVEGRGQRRSLNPLISQSLLDRRIRFNAHLGASAEGKTEYRSFEICIDGDIIKAILHNGELNRLFVNDKRFDIKRLGSRVLSLGESNLFPTFYFYHGDSDGYQSVPQTRDEITSRISELFKLSIEELPEEVRQEIFGLRAGIERPVLPFMNRDQLVAFLSKFGIIKTELLAESPKISELFELILVTYFSIFASAVGDILKPIFQGLSYIGPIRSSGSRFYREQELSVERIDETGANFATYISSLSARELGQFNSLLSETFGVKIRSHSTVGHISLELAKTDSEDYDNLADVGFGFSQLLPLVAQIHSINRRDFVHFDSRSLQILAIEQPELHLHPAAQASLADLFVAAVKNRPNGVGEIKIVLETHSESLIARLGELIASGQLNPDQVVLHFISKDDDSGHSTVIRGEYDVEGRILNWPIGFFSARS